MSTRPWVLAESVWPTVRDARYEIAVRPWGATEAHNTHLPYCTDVIEAESIAIAAAGRAWERGARAVVLPAVPFGVNTGQLAVPFCLNLNPSTQLVVLRDLVRALEPHGVRKLVIVNGHAATTSSRGFASCKRDDAFLAVVKWWSMLDAKPYSTARRHAGELETAWSSISPGPVHPLRSGTGRDAASA